MTRLFVSACILIGFSEAAAAQKFDGLANRPPMGWNSWNTFAGDINEDIVHRTADAIVKTGMRDAGYVYVVLDDCWSTHERDSHGNLVADPSKFPSGMKALGEYLHERGLKFGIYNCAGSQTCAGHHLRALKDWRIPCASPRETRPQGNTNECFDHVRKLHRDDLSSGSSSP